MSEPPSLDAVLQARKSSADSARADDAITLDGQSVITSATSERRKPRKLHIRSGSDASSPANLPTDAAVGNPGADVTESPSPEPRRRRQPRKLSRASSQLADIREESRGGVALEQLIGDANKVAGDSPPNAQTKPDLQSEAATAPSEPTRRRPRKLDRNRPSSRASVAPSPIAEESDQVPAGLPYKSEIDALKDRVRELEAQVRELYERPPVLTARSPRRRGKGRKSSADAGTHSEELSQLQAKLADAQNQLAALRIQQGAAIADTISPNPHLSKGQIPSTRSSRTRPRPRGNSSQPVSEDEVEDIPRSSSPGLEPEAHSTQKAVTLSGSYKFRLPNNLDVKDIKALQDGVTSATNIARTLAASRSTGPRATERTNDSGTWSEWFGSYSQSISRIMNNVEAEAVMEAPGGDANSGGVRLSTGNHHVTARRPVRATGTTAAARPVDGLLG